jgi:acyl-CoA synthetase (NDP forming)
MSSFEPLFNPRGIAIVGASNDQGRPGGQTIAALTGRKYSGGIYPVNPKYETVAGLRCYSEISAVPKDCDVAVIALPAAQVLKVVEECGKHGVRFAVIIGGGFREDGDAGRAREKELLAIAGKYKVRLIGPNCLGFVNVHSNVYAGFGSITRPPYLTSGKVSAVIQSGGFGNSLVIRCGAAGIGFRYVVASGNEADINTPELIDSFVEDPGTYVILAYIEGIGDGRAFMAAAHRARLAGKPLVIWKAGNTRQGVKAAASHTANMAGSYDIYRAAFKEAGVIEVNDMEEAADFVKTLIGQPTAEGTNVAVMGGSGGSAVVFSDAADAYGLTLQSLKPETMRVLKENLPNVASLDNPVDYAAGFINDQNAPRFERAVDAVLSDLGIHQLGLLFATVTGRVGENGANALAAVARRHRKPILVFSSVPRENAPEMFSILESAGIPIFRSVNRLARAMRVLADYRRASTKNMDKPAPVAAHIPMDIGSGVLDEYSSKQLLQAYGVPVTEDRMFPPTPIAVVSAQSCEFPAVLKIVSRDISHKSDIGGVTLNLSSADELSRASETMLQRVRAAAPKAKLEHLMVSPMIRDGLEAIVGVVNDSVFGPVVVFGLGGVYAETLRDITYRLAPFGEETGREMIGELRAAALFDGLRGQQPRDTDALAALLGSVSHLAWDMRDRLKELDINPVIVKQKGEGVVAVDALAVLK